MHHGGYSSKRVDYPMIDSAKIAYFPRIYDLSHRFFEEAWNHICGVSYPEILEKHGMGFPIVHAETDFTHPLRYGDTITAKIWLSKVGRTSCTWEYRLFNQDAIMVWKSSHVTVCIDMELLTPLPIPPFLSDGLKACKEEA